MDVADENCVRAGLEVAVNGFGNLTVLYNNAGGVVPRDSTAENLTKDTLRPALAVDLIGSWLCYQQVILISRANGKVSIINIASAAALVGHYGCAAYSAAKGVVVSFTRALAADQIRVNALAPGATRTAAVDKMIDRALIPKSWLDRIFWG